MTRSLALVTPPGSEPVSLADAKAWARIDASDDDAAVTTLIAAARSAAEEYLRRSLVTQTWKLTLDLAGSEFANRYGDGVYDLPVSALYGGLPTSIPLPKGPVQSITSVTTYDTTNTAGLFAPSNYRVDASGDRLILNSGAIWPSNIRPQAGCEIRYVAGYGTAADVPQPIRQGVLIHVASLYEQRGTCDDALGLPAGTKQLYGPYRVLDYRRG